MVPFLSVTVAIPMSICTNNSPQGLYIWFGFRFCWLWVFVPASLPQPVLGFSIPMLGVL